MSADSGEQAGLDGLRALVELLNHLHEQIELWEPGMSPCPTRVERSEFIQRLNGCIHAHQSELDLLFSTIPNGSWRLAKFIANVSRMERLASDIVWDEPHETLSDEDLYSALEAEHVYFNQILTSNELPVGSAVAVPACTAIRDPKVVELSRVTSRIFKHLASEFKQLRHLPNAHLEWVESGRLTDRLGVALLDAFNRQLLPALIVKAVKEESAKGNLWELFLHWGVFGYHPANIEIFSVEDEETGQASSDYYALEPGCIKLVWPELFQSIIGGEFSDGMDKLLAGQELVKREIFTILGYYKLGCELLSEWIDQQLIAPQTIGWPSDNRSTDGKAEEGLDEDGKAFTWGGRRFDRLTPGMMRVLKLLYDERQKGFPNVTSSTIGRRAGVATDYGIKSQVFKVNRKGCPPIHPVSEIVIDNGDTTYRLIDPDKVPAKVPGGSGDHS